MNEYEYIMRSPKVVCIQILSAYINNFEKEGTY